MRHAVLFLIGTAGGLVASWGCTYRPPFGERASYATVQQATALALPQKGPIRIEWSPASFPDRVDEIGPVGQEGSATSAVIPTGVMLSSRTHELLDAAVGVSTPSDAVLTITVREATSEYRYAQGLITERHIDAARCTLEAEFRCGDLRWEERLVAQATATDSGLEGTKLLETVWDDIALGVAKSVVANLPERPVATTSTAVVPAVPPPATKKPASEAGSEMVVLTTTEELEALKRILIRKRLITEEEWAEIVAEVVSGRSTRGKVMPPG